MLEVLEANAAVDLTYATIFYCYQTIKKRLLKLSRKNITKPTTGLSSEK